MEVQGFTLRTGDPPGRLLGLRLFRDRLHHLSLMLTGDVLCLGGVPNLFLLLARLVLQMFIE